MCQIFRTSSRCTSWARWAGSPEEVVERIAADLKLSMTFRTNFFRLASHVIETRSTGLGSTLSKKVSLIPQYEVSGASPKTRLP